jgi:hypothetical protein
LLLKLTKQLNYAMELEPVKSLRKLSSCLALSVLDKDIHAALLDEEANVQSRIALSHCCVVKHGLALSVPGIQVKWLLAERVQ